MIRRNFVQSIKNLVFSRRCPICKKISQENNYICNECYYLLKKKGKIKNIENYDIENLEKELENITEEKPYSFLVNIAGNCIGASFFSILFLGNINDFLASFLSGLAIAIFSKISDKLNLGTFFTNLLCGFIATVVACFFHYTGLTVGASITIISTLMILVPGVAFINSMRDIFAGDLVTGMSRLMEVAMIGTSIAVGSGVALNIFLRLGGTI